jgi:hypothetical protein
MMLIVKKTATPGFNILESLCIQNTGKTGQAKSSKTMKKSQLHGVLVDKSFYA